MDGDVKGQVADDCVLDGIESVRLACEFDSAQEAKSEKGYEARRVGENLERVKSDGRDQMELRHTIHGDKEESFCH